VGPGGWRGVLAAGFEGGDEGVEVEEVDEAVLVEIGGGARGAGVSLEAGDEGVKVEEVDEAVLVEIGGAGRVEGGVEGEGAAVGEGGAREERDVGGGEGDEGVVAGGEEGVERDGLGALGVADEGDLSGSTLEEELGLGDLAQRERGVEGDPGW